MSDDVRNRPDYVTAIHEAGHAVVARRVGVAVDQIVIQLMPGEGVYKLMMDGLGETQIRVFEESQGPLMATRSLAMTVIAGRIAESRVGRLLPEHPKHDLDIETFRTMIDRHMYHIMNGAGSALGWPPIDADSLGPEHRAYLNRRTTAFRRKIKRDTRALVEREWPSIVRVAEALISGNGHLSGVEVDELIEAAAPSAA